MGIPAEVIAALITVGGIIITGIITLITFKKQEWGKLVSKSRNQWLNEFRNEVSILVGYIEFKIIPNKTNKESCKNDNSDCKKNQVGEQELLRALVMKNRLYTKINTNSHPYGNEYNEAYKTLLETLDFCNLEKFDLDLFKKLTNLILEKEWGKVKKEAKGEK